MPAAVTFPGVYIEEIPSGVRTITGVATSVAAFVDNFARGNLNQPVHIFSMADFEREFGGIYARSEASYAIQQFFLNGGSEAWVSRAASGAFASAAVEIQSAIAGPPALTVTARNPGDWGNGLRIAIAYPDPDTSTQFDMTVTQMQTQQGRASVVAREVYRNLSMSAADARFVETVINDPQTGSQLIQIAASGAALPQLNGTLSGTLNPFPAITAAQPEITVTIGAQGSAAARLAAVPTSLAQAATLLEEAIRAASPGNKAFAQASVRVAGNRLQILAGPIDQSAARVTFAISGNDATAGNLGLVGAPAIQGVLSGDIAGAFGAALSGSVDVTIGGVGPLPVVLAAMNDPAGARLELETQIRAADPSPQFAAARVALHEEAGAARLLVLAGTPAAAVAIANAGIDTTATTLELTGGAATAVLAAVSGNINPVPAIASGGVLDATIGGSGPHTATFGAAANTLATIASGLQTALRAADAAATFTGARVATVSSGTENLLIVLPGVAGDTVTFGAAPADGTTLGELRLDAANAEANVQLYAAGAGAAIPDTAQGAAALGNAGDPPNALDLIGSLNARTGIYALEHVDLFNILCLPRISLATGPDAMNEANSDAVIAAATSYCEARRAFLIVDTPSNIDAVQEISDWADRNASLRHRNLAIYFPRPQIPDPLNDFRLRSVGASGTMAGLYARTDSTRGVWKAPAGTDASLRNVQALDAVLTDGQNGALNPLGINCLRSLPVYGNVAWGARTLEGSDQAASEWKYVPVRRLALFLEESLYRGTQWVVFEPNDEPLWAQIRLNVGAFMQNLFRQGAFQGATPRQAYLVKCDSETTTQNHINLGIVNIVVGFAPLKPAEFVIIQIQQLAGQIQT
ncbi:MAG: phage tail sheath C-terminal domain-containing protein [Dongiaceae bacterium]